MRKQSITAIMVVMVVISITSIALANNSGENQNRYGQEEEPAPPVGDVIIIDISVKPMSQADPAPIDTSNSTPFPILALGEDGFDVRTINLSTLKINDVEVTATSYSYTMPDGWVKKGVTGINDDYEDVILYFNATELAEAGALVMETTNLKLTGEILYSVNTFEGNDAVTVS